VAGTRGQSGNRQEGGLPLLETVNRRLVKTVTEDTILRIIVICKI
jgi:hypothetical protein